MENILVTGGSGLVGTHLRQLLPEAKYISSSDCDLTNEAQVAGLFRTTWDRVIHLAGRVGGILENIGYPSEFIEQNLLMNTLVLKYARLSGVPRLTAILSTCIYPDVFERYPMTEEDLHKGEPQSTNMPYAVAKRALAVSIDACNKQYGTAYNYLIPSNLYGEHDRLDFEKSHFLTALIGKILHARTQGVREVRLLGTGKPLRQFLYAGDLAEVIRKCVDDDICESFNVAPDENLSIREIAELALKACSSEDLELSFDGSSPDGQYRKDVSNAKMKELISDLKFTDLTEGIEKVYSYYKANPAI